MSKVKVSFSVSIDGLDAAPQQSLENPMGSKKRQPCSKDLRRFATWARITARGPISAT